MKAGLVIGCLVVNCRRACILNFLHLSLAILSLDQISHLRGRYMDLALNGVSLILGVRVHPRSEVLERLLLELLAVLCF